MNQGVRAQHSPSVGVIARHLQGMTESNTTRSGAHFSSSLSSLRAPVGFAPPIAKIPELPLQLPKLQNSRFAPPIAKIPDLTLQSPKSPINPQPHFAQI
ncbi:hypothetical protein VNO77_44246 [Canavalia gladiata]|uniref:Uncharacterized protein n=1 Tax=Canavalia gladiata TaxID=3824 RepID=A0AAN9PQK7_CANGL